MNQGDDAYLKNMISLTANKEWGEFIEDLKSEIYQHQANVLESSDKWDQVVYTKGWCAALAYIISLRDRTKISLEQEEANANV